MSKSIITLFYGGNASLLFANDTWIRTFELKIEQHAINNVINSLNTNIYSYLETSGGQSSNLYLNVVHFFNTSVN
jgi:hypothetical protein